MDISVNDRRSCGDDDPDKFKSCYVLNVINGGEAQRMGVLAGDQIVKVRAVDGVDPVPATLGRLREGPTHWAIPQGGLKHMEGAEDFFRLWNRAVQVDLEEMSANILAEQFVEPGHYGILRQIAATCVIQSKLPGELPIVTQVCTVPPCDCNAIEGGLSFADFAKRDSLRLLLAIPNVDVGTGDPRRSLFGFWNDWCYMSAMESTQFDAKKIDIDAVLARIVTAKLVQKSPESWDTTRLSLLDNQIPQCCVTPVAGCKNGHKKAVTKEEAVARKEGKKARTAELERYLTENMKMFASALKQKDIGKGWFAAKEKVQDPAFSALI